MSYQNQLKLKIAARKNYSLIRQLKNYDTKELIIDYNKDVIDTGIVGNISEPTQIVDNVNISLEDNSRSKLTIRQLMPIPKASILQGNSSSTNLNTSNSPSSVANMSAQNVYFLRKMGPGASKPNSAHSKAVFSTNSSRLNTPEVVSDASMHHKKIILNSITRKSAGKKSYLQSYKQVESNLNSYLKCEASQLGGFEMVPREELNANDFQSVSTKKISLNKVEQNLFKKYYQSKGSLNGPSGNQLVNLTFSSALADPVKRTNKWLFYSSIFL